jgi:hypothetical protein
MREALRQQLSDVNDDTWDAGEKENLLLWAMRRLNYKAPRPQNPESTGQVITLVADTYFYDINSDTRNVHKAVLYDADGSLVGRVTAWEVVGDLLLGTADIQVAPSIVETWVGGTLHLYSSANYDLATNVIPDDYVSALLAVARAEALRRLITDRARFKQWQVANQVQNISVNELIQMVNEADRNASEEELLLKQWQLPVTARSEL